MIKKIKKKNIIEKETFQIILFCLRQVQFCRHAAKVMTPNTSHSDTMQDTCKGLSHIFSALGNDFEIIASLAGFNLDLNSKNGQIILEKINSLSNLNKTQAKKCLKEITSLL